MTPANDLIGWLIFTAVAILLTLLFGFAVMTWAGWLDGVLL